MATAAVLWVEKEARGRLQNKQASERPPRVGEARTQHRVYSRVTVKVVR